MKFNTHDPFVFDNVIFFWNQGVWELQRLKIRIANGSQRFLQLHKVYLKNDSIDGLDPVYCGFYCVFNIVSILIDALTIDLKKGPLTLHVAYIIEYRSVHLLTIA